ncbi:MAG TPA: hypothetical protein PLA02_06375 [Brevefilum fermentans]|nr:hypothetical protein [Brevefilum fermentans]
MRKNRPSAEKLADPPAKFDIRLTTWPRDVTDHPVEQDFNCGCMPGGIPGYTLTGS